MTDYKCVNCENIFPKEQLNDLHRTYGICNVCYALGQRWKYNFSVKNAIENCEFEYIDKNIEYCKKKIIYHKKEIKRHKDLIKKYKKEKAKRLRKK